MTRNQLSFIAAAGIGIGIYMLAEQGRQMLVIQPERWELRITVPTDSGEMMTIGREYKSLTDCVLGGELLGGGYDCQKLDDNHQSYLR